MSNSPTNNKRRKGKKKKVIEITKNIEFTIRGN
jgi:hypothetical protein